MVTDDAVGDAEAQAGALARRLGGEERRLDLIQQPGGDTRALVVAAEPHHGAALRLYQFPAQADGFVRMRLRVLVIEGLGRIVDEVERHLDHLLVVGLDVGEVAGDLDQQADLLLAELGLDQADGVGHDPLDRAGGLFTLAAAGKREELADDTGDTPALAADDHRVVLQLLPVIGRQDKLAGVDDGVDGGVDLMGDAGRQFSQEGKLAVAARFGLGLLFLLLDDVDPVGQGHGEEEDIKDAADH